MGDELLDDDDDDVVESEQDDSSDDDSDSTSPDCLSDASFALAAKEQERKRLQDEVEAFLARGGKIQVVGDNVVADPPKKPESNYGGQPI